MPGFWAAQRAGDVVGDPHPDLGLDLEVVPALVATGGRARAKPSSSHGRYSSIRPGTKCIGSHPSHSSAVRRTVASAPEPSQIGRFGSPWRIDRSGLPSPIAPGPVYGSEISRPSCSTGSLRSKILRMIWM